MNEEALRHLLVLHIRSQLNALASTLELLINATPSGKLRNEITAVNLHAELAGDALKRVVEQLPR